GLLLAAYKGSTFGGEITAISFGIPGTPASIVATFDGYKLTKMGYPKKAMDTALYTSFVADLFSDVLTILIVVPLAALSVAFGPRELFTLMLLALIMIILLIENHKPIRALCSILIGLFLASIGPDPITGGFRFIFGFNFLLGGIEFVPFLIGMVALSLIWTNIGLIIKQIGVFGSYSQQKKEEMLISRKPDDYLTFKEWLKFWREI
ncbi:unnamed protein product, partial [marine sediment metagenome]